MYDGLLIKASYYCILEFQRKMEELQSTENLEREILEDARKKAQRILKAADETIRIKNAEWEKTTGEALTELEKRFAGLYVLAANEITAVLPIDKRRAKAEKLETLLQSAVETWYSNLSRDRVLGFLKNELEKRIIICGGFSVQSGTGSPCLAAVSNLTLTEAESILKEILPGVSCKIEKTKYQSDYPEFILENSDVRICASVKKTADYFLSEKRAELVEVLLGGKVPEGALC